MEMAIPVSAAVLAVLAWLYIGRFSYPGEWNDSRRLKRIAAFLLGAAGLAVLVWQCGGFYLYTARYAWVSGPCYDFTGSQYVPETGEGYQILYVGKPSGTDKSLPAVTQAAYYPTEQQITVGVVYSRFSEEANQFGPLWPYGIYVKGMDGQELCSRYTFIGRDSFLHVTVDGSVCYLKQPLPEDESVYFEICRWDGEQWSLISRCPVSLNKQLIP